jgi:hypothetical protein
VNFSLTLQTNPKLRTAIDGIDETMWTPVRYPGAVLDTDTGRWIRVSPTYGRAARPMNSCLG